MNEPKNINNHSHKPLVVALDIDGVVLDFLVQWEIACEQYLQRKVSIKKFVYSLPSRYGLTPQEFQGAWDYFLNAGHWERIPERANAIEHINEMCNMGIDVHLVTAANSNIAEARRKNLTTLGLPLSVQIHCTNGFKAEKLAELQPGIFVDDHDFHLKEAKEVGVVHRVQIPNHPFDNESIHSTRIECDLKNVVALARQLHSQKINKLSPIENSICL